LHREVASSGTRCSCCKLVVLITLGGCNLLDGLVACGSIEAHKKIVRGSGEALQGVLEPFLREIVIGYSSGLLVAWRIPILCWMCDTC
jgi:hypothetical protein